MKGGSMKNGENGAGNNIDETAKLFAFLAKRLSVWTLAFSVASFAAALILHKFFPSLVNEKAKIIFPVGIMLGSALSFARMRINKNTLHFLVHISGNRNTVFASIMQIASIAALFFVLVFCIKKNFVLFCCIASGMLILPLIIIVYRKSFDALC